MPDLAQAFSSFYRGYIIPSYHEQVTYMRRIDQRMQSIGATPTPGWDTVAGFSDTFMDGTFGSAWTYQGRQGYMAPIPMTVGINDTARVTEVFQGGYRIYEGPVIFWQDPYVIYKGDLIVKTDGTRYRVGDQMRPYQVWGEPVVYSAKLEQPQTNDVLYLVPLV